MSVIPLDEFDSKLAIYTEVSSVAIGGKICSVSDEFFAPASDLLLVPPAPSLKGQFGPNGALFSGWESRRHNPEHDWVIIKLGPPSAFLKGFDIDTAWFTGNHGPAASVEGIHSPEVEPTNASDQAYTHVRLQMYPDGGIARFRCYGVVQPIWLPASAKPHEWDLRSDSKGVLGGLFGGERKEGEIDLAHSFNGGHCVYESDKHYGVGANLLLPGRGLDMGDGWETKRSRTPGHNDFTIIKLGAPGLITHVNIDTLHFKGNFPAGVEVHAINSTEELPAKEVASGWVSLLARTKVGPHSEHYFAVDKATENKVFTHVRMTMYPDGGVKRLRVYGTRATTDATVQSTSSLATQPTSTFLPTTSASSSAIPILPLEPLTLEAFAPYGTPLQSHPSSTTLPFPSLYANAGTAVKQPRLTLPVSSYPPGSNEVLGLGVFRATPAEGFKKGTQWQGRMWERHPYTSQTFIPMGKKEGDLVPGGEGMVVVVALNGKDDKPDLTTARAFLASPAQGVTYNTGTWHHSLLTYTKTDFACLETQCSPDGSDPKDCEVLRKAPEEDSWYVVEV